MRFRADSHSYDRDPKRDCLHYCLPGPVDSWVEFLYNALRMIKGYGGAGGGGSSSIISTASNPKDNEDNIEGERKEGGGKLIAPYTTAKAWTRLHIQSSDTGIILYLSHCMFLLCYPVYGRINAQLPRQ